MEWVEELTERLYELAFFVAQHEELAKEIEACEGKAEDFDWLLEIEKRLMMLHMVISDQVGKAVRGCFRADAHSHMNNLRRLLDSPVSTGGFSDEITFGPEDELRF